MTSERKREQVPGRREISDKSGQFMWHGLVDYRLGLILGVTMFVGALVGARLAIKVETSGLGASSLLRFG